MCSGSTLRPDPVIFRPFAQFHPSLLHSSFPLFVTVWTVLQSAAGYMSANMHICRVANMHICGVRAQYSARSAGYEHIIPQAPVLQKPAGGYGYALCPRPYLQLASPTKERAMLAAFPETKEKGPH
jgi:hypothetical protein